MAGKTYNNLISYNCKSLKRSIDGVRCLCKLADVIALQETWLLPHDLPFLNAVDDEFGSTGTSAVDTSAGLLRGRPFGGVAILWRKSAFQSVKVLECNDVRLAAVKINYVSDKSVIIFSVYMPTNSSENLPEFTQCLSRICSIIDDNRDTEAIYILGDFNAQPEELFCNEMLAFCNDQDWTCVDIEMLGAKSDTFTFVSEAHGCTRWLDHCIVTGAALPSVKRVWIERDVQWSDHFPLIIECDLGQVSSKEGGICTRASNKVLWGERTKGQIENFNKICHHQLREIDFPGELSACCDGICYNVEHRTILRNMYVKLVSVLSEAAANSNEQGVSRRRGGYVAGWNKYVAGFHREARLHFLVWVQAGKPNNGQLYLNMCESRRAFKKQLKWCQDKQDQIKMDILASHHTARDFKTFWKHTNKMNVKSGLPVSLNGIGDHTAIANLFRDYFKVEPHSDSDTSRGDNAEAIDKERVVKFTSRDVQKVILGMQRGKSPGHDGLSIEHLKFAGTHLPRVLSMFYNLCLCHGYLPEELTKTIVVPIVKNKTVDVSDKENYRPISLATILAKVLDSLLNNILLQHIKLNDAQFGFRNGLSTESAILCLKQAVGYYTERKTPVYACFLDLSKAFDRVLYNKLWVKLEGAGVPAEVISVLRYWYTCQRNQVRWAGTLSDAYGMECGVRQGGITSPLLFNLYVNDLIGELSSTHVGCFVDGVSVNNISYADDMVLLGPSVGAIRKLVSICEAYAAEHGLRYNTKKSEVLVFKSGKRGPVHVPPIMLNGAALRVVSSFKYLGHIVTEELQDDADIERERRALAVRGNMVARRFARCSRAVKITLFKAYCQSLYSSSLWVACTRRAASALRVQYNNVFRMLMRLPRYCSASGMFAEARTDGFHAVIRKKVASLLQRVRGSSNSILQMVVSRADCPIQNKWMNIMMGVD